LLRYESTVDVVVGVLVIVLGAAFLGFIPGMQREWRMQKLPAAGLVGAPVLGAVFALSWVPCISPTLGAVLGLSLVGGQPGRAVTLAAAYCLGLGLPFLIFGLGFRRMIGVFQVIRRNSRWVTRVGGALLIVIGLVLVTGAWTPFLDWLRATVGSGQVGI
jgi:cytochrome c-type biogenesis protein